MRSKIAIPVVAIALSGLAACGSSKSSSSTKTVTTTATHTAPAQKTATGNHKPATVPSRTYSLKLTGKAETPRGAPNGSGRAVITLHGSTNQVCWHFSRLRGFASPTFAHIHEAPAGKAGKIVIPLSTGQKFLAKGCANSNTNLIKAIEKDPPGYYVNVHSKQYPAGAVRAQL